MDNDVKNLENEMINNNPQVADYLYDLSQTVAERAFRNTSFSPEKRAVRVRLDYAESLLVDKAQVLNEISKASNRGAHLREDHAALVDEWFKSHRDRLKDCYNAWLYSHARVASSFITGPANFPVARNQKLSDYADAKLFAIDEFRKKSTHHILKLVLPFGDGYSIQTDDPEVCNKIKNKIETLEKQRDDMKAINKVLRKYFKKGNPDISSEQLAELKQVLGSQFNMHEKDISEIIEPNYSGKVIGFERWQLQNLGANIKRYKKRLSEVEKTNSVSIEEEFSNGIRVSISDDQKICIHFGFKPSEEVRSVLKENAFKFSRNRENAWVRKLTLNAASSYVRYVRPKIKVLEAS